MEIAPLSQEKIEEMTVKGVRPSSILFGGSLEYIVQLEQQQG